MKLLIGSKRNYPGYHFIYFFSPVIVVAVVTGWLLPSDLFKFKQNRSSHQEYFEDSPSFASNLLHEKSFQNLAGEGTTKSISHKTANKSVSMLLKDEDFRFDIHLPRNSEIENQNINFKSVHKNVIREILKPGFSGEKLQAPLIRKNQSSRFVSLLRTAETTNSLISSDEIPKNFKIIDSVTGQTITSRSEPAEHYRFSGARNLHYGADLDQATRQRDFTCLSKAIYFEARGEPQKGQKAVAQVVMNRVRSSNFPDTVCGVVLEGEHLFERCQFSFACDGKPDVISSINSWGRAKSLAESVFDGQVWLDEIGTAIHYHADTVNPEWAGNMKKIASIGNHIFYLRP